MSNYKLTYFDFNGGRGEPIRIALHAAEIPFEDVRWSFPEFAEKNSSLPFHAVPALEMDGITVTQSNAISRYVGKLAGLYPEDPLQALYCDEVLGALEDMTRYMTDTFSLEGEELKHAREELMRGKFTVFVKAFETLLERGGGQYFADQRLTIADLKMFDMMRNLRSGNLDHIPADFIDKLAPVFIDYHARIEQEPQVLAYYASLA